ncbi:hypothetical protein BGW39_001504 [Mortierella sp. 14UC]|nr:hypothetical protein BGW39_001504 [Mortierella sp. 14UC]
MMLQLLSLLLVAMTTLAETSSTFRTDPRTQGHHERRTLIGNQILHPAQVDNSRSKQIFRIDHCADSSIRQGGLLYDLERRGLLSDLAGSGKTGIENINDNTSQSQSMNSQGNTHTTTITRIHREPYPEGEQWIRQHGLINQRSDNLKDSETPMLLDRRGLLWGGSSMIISNVNDNSHNTNTYNSHGNRSKKITKVVSTKEGEGARGSRGGRGRDDDLAESWFDKHADEILEHSQTRRALYRVDLPSKPQPQLQHQGQGDLTSTSINKRLRTLTTTTAIVQFDDGSNDSSSKDESKKVDAIARRHLVTIQIVTQNTNTNTNGHTNDNSRNNNNVYPVKVIRSGSDSRKKKKEKGSSSSARRPHPASKSKDRSKRPERIETKSRDNQTKKHHRSHEHKDTLHATKSSKSRREDKKAGSQQSHQSRPMHAKTRHE